jgi:outer membrane protein W
VKDQLVNIFLECLISGKTSIYYCHQRYAVGDLEKNDHYYAEKDTNFVELYAEKSFTNNDGRSFIQRTDQYKGALSAFFVDDPDIQGRLKKTDLNSKSLIDIAKQYHEDVCTANQCVVYEKKAIKRLFQFGVEASYFCSSLDFYEDRNRLTLNTAPKYDITTSVFAATNLDYDYRFWFQVELNYRKQEIDKTKVDVLIHQTTYNFKWSTLSSDLVLKYRFFNLKFKPYAFLGYGVGLVLDKEYIKTEGNLNVGNFTSRNIELDDKYTTNLFGGVGCEYVINSNSNLLFSLKYMLNRIPTVDSNGISCSVGYFISVF